MSNPDRPRMGYLLSGPWWLNTAIAVLLLGCGYIVASTAVEWVRGSRDEKRRAAADTEPIAVVVLGAEHHPQCLVARYRKEAEAGGDLFPWCTCRMSGPLRDD